ncbi:hypothetical protein [Fructobacillus tropaeoli]|uniref:Uncharacterized protein n=1 Tax=Fructobacillus tropaeoli TaxID=709323 RepID=A0A3F3H6V4_9LACO|nr:hypothetical protein [Fructobacillus tropaeoli]GAP03460.1 hypothetical protein FTRO_0010020 [Fructobacillus tropaeoli]
MGNTAAVGYYSNQLFIVGKSKAEVLRKLQEAYPQSRRRHDIKPNYLYPEPLRLIEDVQE